MKTAVVDIDGVLVDCSERLRRCLEESGGRKNEGFWNCFLSPRYMHLDRPVPQAIELVRQLKRAGYRIVIVTGRRSDTQFEATTAQLQRFGVPFDEIYMRRPNDRRKDAEYKAEIVLRLIKKGYEVKLVIDDSEAVCRKLSEILPRAKIMRFEKKEARAPNQLTL
ncbi:MAG: phosphatase [Crenarchaeota archaeon]|nr:phosphatase [Thermoproteota archaeon]